MTEKEKLWSDQHLEKKVFIYGSEKKDKIFFKNAIIEYFNLKEFKDFNFFINEKLWHLNESGKFIKYMYFNEYSQRLYIDKYFKEWIDRMFDKINQELSKIDSHEKK